MEKTVLVVQLNPLCEIAIVGGRNGLSDLLLHRDLGLAVTPFHHRAAALALGIDDGIDRQRHGATTHLDLSTVGIA